MLWKFSAPFTSQSNFVLGCTLCSRWDLMWFARRSAHQQEAAGITCDSCLPQHMKGIMRAPSGLWWHPWMRGSSLGTLAQVNPPLLLGAREHHHGQFQPQHRLPLLSTLKVPLPAPAPLVGLSVAPNHLQFIQTSAALSPTILTEVLFLLHTTDSLLFLTSSPCLSKLCDGPRHLHLGRPLPRVLIPALVRLMGQPFARTHVPDFNTPGTLVTGSLGAPVLCLAQSPLAQKTFSQHSTGLARVKCQRLCALVGRRLSF